MNGSSGSDITEALWKFFIDAGGFPQILQCDFDPKIIGGKAAQLLKSHGTSISDKSNFTPGELTSTEFLETLSELLADNTLSTNLGEMKTKLVHFLCDNKNPCKIAHTT